MDSVGGDFDRRPFQQSCDMKSTASAAKSAKSTGTPGDFTPAAEPDQWLADYGDSLFRFAVLRLNCVHLAEDLVQETFVKAFRGFDRFRHDSSVRSWLFQILKNEIASHFRSAATRRVVDLDSSEVTPIEELLGSEISTEQFKTATERDEFWRMAQICFEKVPEHLLETFLQRLANPDQTVDQLCHQLGITATNFHVRMFRTRLLLRRCIEKSWINVE